jgi:predicted DNA-binding transcriptional regulator YafY
MAWDSEPPPVRTCRLRIRQGAGHGLRRHARSVTPARQSGWDEVEVTFTDLGWFAEQIASFGADVVVLEPMDLRDAVIGRLKGVLA